MRVWDTGSWGCPGKPMGSRIRKANKVASYNGEGWSGERWECGAGTWEDVGWILQTGPGSLPSGLWPIMAVSQPHPHKGLQGGLSRGGRVGLM